MKIKVAGVFWEVRLLTSKDFILIHGENFINASAVTNVVKKQVDFRTDDISEIHVRHEMYHMYADTQLIHDSDLNSDQFEENAACLMGKYGEEYIKSCRKVYNWIKKEMSK